MASERINSRTSKSQAPQPEQAPVDLETSSRLSMPFSTRCLILAFVVPLHLQMISAFISLIIGQPGNTSTSAYLRAIS